MTTLQSGRVVLDHAQEVILANSPDAPPVMVSITGTLTATETVPSTLLAGLQTGTTNALPLNNGVSLACSEVMVQNQPINAINVLVGNATLQAVHLTPDSVVAVAIDNVNKVYVKTPSGTSVVAWLAS